MLPSGTKGRVGLSAPFIGRGFRRIHFPLLDNSTVTNNFGTGPARLECGNRNENKRFQKDWPGEREIGIRARLPSSLGD